MKLMELFSRNRKRNEEKSLCNKNANKSKSNSEILKEIQAKRPNLKEIHLTKGSDMGGYYKLKAVESNDSIILEAVDSVNLPKLRISVNNGDMLSIKDCTSTIEFDNWILIEPREFQHRYFQYCINTNKVVVNELSDILSELRKYTDIRCLEENVETSLRLELDYDEKIEAIKGSLTTLATYVLNTYLVAIDRDVSKVDNSNKMKLINEMVIHVLINITRVQETSCTNGNVTFKMREVLDKSELLKELIN